MVATGGSLYLQCLMILGGAIIAAPLFKRLGLGTVLGYLAAGITIGPVARLIADGEDFLHFSELGVVFLLFIIGLELKPSRLWALRQSIFGLGTAQVLLCGAALTALGIYFAGLSPEAGIIIGFGLALSSTAFAMQVLEDRAETNQKHGQRAFRSCCSRTSPSCRSLQLFRHFRRPNRRRRARVSILPQQLRPSRHWWSPDVISSIRCSALSPIPALAK